MLQPRWYKVIRDLWSHKTRTFLVTLSITVGVFAVGMIGEGRARMLRGLTEPFLAGNPFSAELAIKEPFDAELVEAIERIDGVAVAQGTKYVKARIETGPNQWETLNLRSVEDFDDIRISRMTLEAGPWPPPDNTVLLERSALNEQLGVNLQVGDVLHIETTDQLARDIPVVGVVHDLHVPPTMIMGEYYGYITADTLDWFGESQEFNAVRFMVQREQFANRDFVDIVTRNVCDKIERSGREVTSIFVPPEPGKNPIVSFGLDPIIYVMSVLAIMVVFLSGFLVTNTISALLAQEIKQIGVMKAIGAQQGQILRLYLAMVLCIGMLAVAIGVPLGQAGAGLFTAFFAGMLNFDPVAAGITPEVFILQLIVGLVVPLIAAILPVLKGTRISVRQAISTGGSDTYGTGFIDKFVSRLHGNYRPLMLSLRNTFRRKGRLALTIITLSLGGAIFISVLSVQAAVTLTFSDLFSTLVRYDVQVEFEQPYRLERIEQVAHSVPGVRTIEGWGGILARRLRPNDSESEMISFRAPPFGSPMVQPHMIHGRWLLPNDQNAVVLSTSWLQNEPDVLLGDTITLKFQGRETEWVVVGFFRGLDNSLIAYTNYAYFAHEVREVGTSQLVNVVTRSRTTHDQEQVAQILEDYFRAAGLHVTTSTTATAERTQSQASFGITITLLMVMAILIAIVGGLGLMGTMTLNVLERKREIGVMRAIGASNSAILHIVITEGVFIGLISWMFGLVLAWPLSLLLSQQVGLIFLGAPFLYVYSWWGATLWLIIVVGLAALASFLPAWNASRLTVRDVLSHT